MRGRKMKKRIFLFAVTIIIVFFHIHSSNLGSQKAKWKGKIEEVDGIQVVKNPKEPIYKPDVFSFEEDLRIGKEGDNKYMFSQIRDIAVDGQENIYVADDKEINIKVYDKSGQYLRTIGRQGQGPGEIGRPYGIQVVNDRELMVHDGKNRRVHYFSLEGEFLRDIKFGLLWHSKLYTASNKYYYAIVWLSEPPNSRMELMKLDAELNKLETIGIMTMSDPPQPIELFRPEITYKIMHNDCLLYGYPEDYELQIFSPEGKLIKKITRKYDPIPVSDEDRQRAEKDFGPDRKLIFKKYRPAYVEFLTDDQGWIYVWFSGMLEKGQKINYDVFDAEGKYLTKIQLPFRPHIWNKGKIYTIEEDEEGFHIVKRYKVTWKIK